MRKNLPVLKGDSLLANLFLTLLVVACLLFADARISEPQEVSSTNSDYATLVQAQKLREAMMSPDFSYQQIDPKVREYLEYMATQSESVHDALDDFQQGHSRAMKEMKNNKSPKQGAPVAPPANPPAAQPSSSKPEFKLIDFLFNSCKYIGTQFQVKENVNCTCSGSLINLGALTGGGAAGGIEFECPLSKEQCIAGDIVSVEIESAWTSLCFPYLTNDPPITFQCGTPVYTGTVSLLGLSVENKICVNDLEAGFIPVGDFCITITAAPISGELISCTASIEGGLLGGLLPEACLSCKITDLGATVDCSNVLAGAVAVNDQIGYIDGNPDNQIVPYIPNFSGIVPAYEAAQGQNSTSSQNTTSGAMSWLQSWLSTVDASKIPSGGNN
jgi:hypothetical protein